MFFSEDQGLSMARPLPLALHLAILHTRLLYNAPCQACLPCAPAPLQTSTQPLAQACSFPQVSFLPVTFLGSVLKKSLPS